MSVAIPGLYWGHRTAYAKLAHLAAEGIGSALCGTVTTYLGYGGDENDERCASCERIFALIELAKEAPEASKLRFGREHDWADWRIFS